MVLDGERASVHNGPRVEIGVFAAGDRDGPQLPAGGAVLDHVAPGDDGVPLGRGQEPVGGVKGGLAVYDTARRRLAHPPA